MRMTTRKAGKAGTWYPSDRDTLESMICNWFDMIDGTESGQFDHNVQALIVPHAGFRYSGFTAAHAYKQVCHMCRPVMIFHPSHHARLTRLRQCPFDSIDTPLGALPVQHIDGIQFNTPTVDEEEHSAELQFPFLRLINASTVSTVMVGREWSGRDVQAVRDHVKKFPDTLIIVSTDFCHFGPNYGYNLTGFDNGKIEQMDMQGFQAIQSGDCQSFIDYLHGTQNTICGQDAILVAMDVLKQTAKGAKGKWKLLHYCQSSKDLSITPNSVSYLAAGYFESKTES